MLNWLMRLFGKSHAEPPRVTSGDDLAAAIDAYRRVRPPSALQLLNELKNVAYTCASINAGSCAANPPRLYVMTRHGQPAPKCLTKSLSRSHPLVLQHKGEATVEEVIEHPLLTLFRQVNPRHNAQDLWELTTLYQEVHGSAYWLIEKNALGIPSAIWPLPSHQVTPYREKNSDRLIDHYEHRVGSESRRYLPEEIIHFSYPDPRDPYLSGLSPLRAAYELINLGSQFLAYRRAVIDNHAMPSAIISPSEVIGEEEADRLETKWNQRFRRGGNGKILVAESALSVALLGNQLGDVAALAEAGATKEDICNAFGVPLAFLSTETNLANLQAAQVQHGKSLLPKLRRRDEKLNEQLIPLYDDSGRLFLESDSPVEEDRNFNLLREEMHLRRGVRTINEVRAEMGLEPVAWGDKPYKPSVSERRPLAEEEL